MRPPRRPAPPQWDVAEVLRTLCLPPFEPLEEASDHHLSVKTAFLVAVCTGFRVSDLEILSVQDECLILQEDLSQVVLRPNPAFLGKAGPSAQIQPAWLRFRPLVRLMERVCSFSALSELSLLTWSAHGPSEVPPVSCSSAVGEKRGGRPLSAGPSRAGWWRPSQPRVTQLLGALPLPTRQEECRVFSVALLQGVSFKGVCLSARWSSSNTFCRYYLRDVGSISFSYAVLATAKRGPQ